MATCIPLSGSTTCPAFGNASISTNSTLFGQFPFLRGVSSLADFDTQLSNYVSGQYVLTKYAETLKCQGVNLTNADAYYARYTTSFICNGVVQSSKSDCNLSDQHSRPLCASSCAYMATSEEEIVVNPNLCRQPGSQYMPLIRADYTVCSLPSASLTDTCILGSDNEPDNCGYGANLLGLCQYCGTSTTNATDSCCINSDVNSRCIGVKLPTATATLQPIVATSTATSSPAAGSGASDHTNTGLTGGQIAGIVVGSVVGAALVLGLLLLLLFCLRRRRNSHDATGLNRPNPQRRGMPNMQQARSQPSLDVIPGRVARMTALREVPSKSPARSGAANSRAKYSDSSDSEGYGASPGAMSRRMPPVTGRRNGSLSSTSVFAGVDSDASPRSRSGTEANISSPEGVASGQSEQLPYFRDYYSEDDIHPGDKVAVLWAYQPRAGDEFELDRGEMLKVIGIWDDGWATGVRISDRAEDVDLRLRDHRDSGISNISQKPLISPAPTGEIKAFPLVCVCLPQHWGKIIDGEMPDVPETEAETGA